MMITRESIMFIVIDVSIPERNLSENFFRLNKSTVSPYNKKKKKRGALSSLLMYPHLSSVWSDSREILRYTNAMKCKEERRSKVYLKTEI